MGVSILSGCLTTFGCGCMLFGGQFVFFQKFAFIIVITVVFAIIIAIFTFGALCHTLGPEGLCGELDWRKYKKKDDQGAENKP